jgi:serine protease Do
MNLRSKLIIVSALILAIAAGVFGYRAFITKSINIGISKSANNNAETMHSANPPLPNPFIPNFEPLATKVKPSLVNINTERKDVAKIRNPFEYFFYGNDAFEDAFSGSGSHWISLGSGFIVNSNGYILTNSHVIENASKISVKLVDRRIVSASVVGTDPKTDLAVLKIPSSNLPVLHLAKSDTVAAGDWVAAFGRPFSLEVTLSAGIISTKGRNLGSELYDKLLQTDAAINPENSGGPLVNLRGEVIGINTVVVSQHRGFKGIGFAIPADAAQRIYDRLVRSGKSARGWMGVLLQDITPELARSFNLNRLEGALVSEVAADGPAAKAGVRSGDIILEYNGRPVRNRDDLSSAVAESKAGASIPIRILRNGRRLTISMAVGERPSDVAQHFISPRMREPGKLGVTIENIAPETQAALHLASTSGVLVVDVIPGSAADNGGVRPGDIIHAINHIPVNTAVDLLAVMRTLNQDSTVLLRLEREGKTFYSAFRLS